MSKHFAIGDMITARIMAFDRTRDPMLTVQDRDLGKIPRGELLKISATRVPRLIGKRGSMIQTIEQATQTRVLIGQNGIVVVTGRNPEGINLSVRAIQMVEDEAHTANLTQRIKVLLNVPDTPQEITRAPIGNGDAKSGEAESTMGEVEEELEVEGEK
jgi:exosome complex component RRP4